MLSHLNVSCVNFNKPNPKLIRFKYVVNFGAKKNQLGLIKKTSSSKHKAGFGISCNKVAENLSLFENETFI